MHNKTPFSSGNDLKEVMANVEYDFITLVEWFCANYFTLNAANCHSLASGCENEAMFA